MRYVSLFSGIEAASVAWGPLGWEAMAFSEIDPFPCVVLAHRFPDVPNLGDVCGIDWEGFKVERGVPDVVVGGSPCQSFSIAGRREGLAGASGLMWEFVRACDQLRPRWVVWENVPGALSSSGGEDFRCLLESLDELGHCVAWRVLDAQFFGVAQRRRRVFLVGSLGWGGSCEVLLEPESMLGDPVPSREKRAELAARAGFGAAGPDGALNCRDHQSVRVYSQDGVAPTLNAGTCKTGSIQPSVLVGGSAAFKYAAAASAGSTGYEEELPPTLIADYHNPAVITPVYAVRMREGKAGGDKGPLVQEDVSGTLATGNDQTIFCLGDAAANASCDEGMCGALKANNDRNPPIVAFGANQRGEVRLQGGDGQVVGALQASASAKQVNAVCECGTRPAVRRLTPRECERLQGFPDDWTLVPYKGKPAEECPDTPRYRAIGNSMAVPVMRWIGMRLGEADARRRE